MGRRYSRRRNINSGASLVWDVIDICDRLPWWGALVFASFIFGLFYWMFPAWILSNLSDIQGNQMKQLFEVALSRRIHWFQYLGMASGLAGLFLAVKNYLWPFRLTSEERQGVGFFARIFGRWLD